MRSLLVCLAVVLMAGFVSASTITLTTPSGTTDVFAGDTITVTASDAAGGFGGFGSFTINVDNVADFVSGWINPGCGGMIPTGMTPVVAGTGFNAVMAGIPFATTPTGDIWSITFDVAASAMAGDVITIAHTSGSWNNAFSGVVATQTLNVVPEPMTLALLGLGGLFLRRRK